MICYRDQTFCSFHKECEAGKECFRALTDEVHVDAMVWWKGENPPICQFAAKPECFKEASC